MFPKMAIEIPVEWVREYSDQNMGVVRTVSFLYYNVEDLFPSGFPGRENE